MNEYQTRLEKARTALNNADSILFGAGAGLAAAGLDYAGQRFTDNFADFIEKYGLTDMYTATFYPFPTPEESWAHWARHIEVNRFAQPALPLYKDLLRLVQSKEFFVLTTNVEAQFAKAGFPVEKIFATQGDYAYLQCAKGCHEQLYDNEELIKAMLAHTRDFKIPVLPGSKMPLSATVRWRSTCGKTIASSRMKRGIWLPGDTQLFCKKPQPSALYSWSWASASIRPALSVIPLSR